jgi:hypothetical protein
MVSDSQILRWCRILRWNPDTTMSDSHVSIGFSDAVGLSGYET